MLVSIILDLAESFGMFAHIHRIPFITQTYSMSMLVHAAQSNGRLWQSTSSLAEKFRYTELHKALWGNRSGSV